MVNTSILSFLNFLGMATLKSFCVKGHLKYLILSFFKQFYYMKYNITDQSTRAINPIFLNVLFLVQ